MILKNKSIVIVSNEVWGNIWYSKHNWAHELSKQNTVYFFNPPKRWSLKNLFRINLQINKYSKSLAIINYNNVFPLTKYHLIFKVNEYIVSIFFKNWFKKHSLNELLFWTFDPYRFSNPKLISPSLSIYFIADKYHTKYEKTLINNVDYIISVSKILTDYLSIQNPLVLSHGIAESEFNADKDITFPTEFILYIGGIDHRLNYSFIKKIVEQNPKQTFLFIGKIAHQKNPDFYALFEEKNYPNFIYKQPIHFKELKNYIAKAKLCIAPMNLKVNGNNINHHKLLQYLAMGKPVLSPSFKDYNENSIIYTYQNDDDGCKRFKTLINQSNNEESINKRISFAKEFTYKKLIHKIEEFLQQNSKQ